METDPKVNYIWVMRHGFKIIMIHMCKEVDEKRVKFTRGPESFFSRKIQIKILEMKNTVTEMDNSVGLTANQIHQRVG